MGNELDIVKKNLVRRSESSISIMDYGKLPPQAAELEKSVLGAIMIEHDCINGVIKILRGPDYFYVNAHQLIYSAIIQLWSNDSPIDLLTVTEQLRHTESLDAAGGPYYVAQLTNCVGSAANAEYHATVLKEKWVQRSVIATSSEMCKDAYEDSCDPFDLLERGLNEFQKVLTDVRSSSDESWDAQVDEFTANVKKAAERKDDEKYIIGRPTGVYVLDRKIMGLCDTHLIIYAGRPGEGKTTLMLQGVRENAKRGVPVGVFSLEMSTQELILKMISMEAQLEIEKLRQGALTQDEWHIYNRVAKEIAKWPIHVCETPGVSINEVKAVAKGWSVKFKIQALFLDYIQLMSVGENKRINNREQEIAHISRNLKALAKEIHAPVIALSQMSREIENRPKNDKRPRNSDLRESGSLEQDANEIIFIFRPQMHGIDKYEDGTSTEGITEFIVTKSRLGSTGIVKGSFDGRFSRFSDANANYQRSYSPKSETEDTPF